MFQVGREAWLADWIGDLELIKRKLWRAKSLQFSRYLRRTNKQGEERKKKRDIESRRLGTIKLLLDYIELHVVYRYFTALETSTSIASMWLRLTVEAGDPSTLRNSRNAS